MNKKVEFARHCPGAFFLEEDGEPQALQSYLLGRGWLLPEAGVLGVEKAGEGNMNCTLRVLTSGGSLIVKQARPWVEKYDEIPAPIDRLLTESRFYQVASGVPAVSALMPRLIGYDPMSRVLCLEDLGVAGDLTTLYRGTKLSASEQGELLDFLVALHELQGSALRGFPENRAMRELNHEHLFRFPLLPDNGLDLDRMTPGLAKAAAELKGDRAYVARVTELGERYLGQGTCLLHGDFYPGSWLGTSRGLRVIDPEFGFIGPAELDLGIFLAHLHLSGHPEATAQAAVERYGARHPFDSRLARGFAGVEIMRRLLGVAQLPLAADLTRKRNLLRLSRSLLLN